MISDLRSLTAAQRNTFLASFLGWTFDAFDFFVMVFVLRPLAEDFGRDPLPYLTLRTPILDERFG